jgi:hypothetical protein
MTLQNRNMRPIPTQTVEIKSLKRRERIRLYAALHVLVHQGKLDRKNGTLKIHNKTHYSRAVKKD